MKILTYEEGSFVKIGYPKTDISEPVEGLKPNIQFYYLEDIKPEYDKRFYKLIRHSEYTLTTETHPEYTHLLKAVQGYSVELLPQDAIIQRINDSLGAHLDNNYLPQTRVKHSDELNGIYGEISVERESYLKSLKDWVVRCIEARDAMENELINSNTLPSLEWEPKPIN